MPACTLLILAILAAFVTFVAITMIRSYSRPFKYDWMEFMIPVGATAMVFLFIYTGFPKVVEVVECGPKKNSVALCDFSVKNGKS